MKGSVALATSPNVQLERVAGRWTIAAYGLGGIIGAGIFAVTGVIAGIAGHLAPFAFLIAAIPACLAALSYSALVSTIPKAGGEASYIAAAFKRQSLTLAITLAVALSGILASAALAKAYGGYFATLTGGPLWFSIGHIAVLATCIALLGARMSIMLVVGITIAEVLALLLLVAFGLDAFGPYISALPSAFSDQALNVTITNLGIAAVLAFFAFVGFEDMVNMAEEVVEPERNMPPAIFIAFGASILIYMAVAIVAVQTVAPEKLALVDDPLRLVAAEQGVIPPQLISLFALISISNGLLIQINMVSRLLFGSAKLGALPPAFAWVHPRSRTPVWSILLTGFLILLLAMSLPLERIAGLTSLILLVVFAAVQTAAIVLIKRGTLRAAYLPLWVPAVGIFLAFILMVFWTLNQFS